jgi:hypothetical protein
MVALLTARTLTDINTGELVTAKVKNAVYNKAQEKRAQQLSVTKPGSCNLTLADDKIEWRYASTTALRYKGYNRDEMNKKILCYELTHHAGAYFNEREIRHSPDLLDITLLSEATAQTKRIRCLPKTRNRIAYIHQATCCTIPALAGKV